MENFSIFSAQNNRYWNLLNNTFCYFYSKKILEKLPLSYLFWWHWQNFQFCFVKVFFVSECISKDEVFQLAAIL